MYLRSEKLARTRKRWKSAAFLEVCDLSMADKIKTTMPEVTNHLLKNDDNLKEVTRQHIPYILNGELYRIESQNGDNVTVKCCNCPPDRIYRGSVRSTGNFHMHIKRRHASLLGRLHEMKVAALVERRDRVIKNRFVKRGKRETTSLCEEIGAVDTSNSSTTNCEENHELKIKTVFQRHKQEYHEQEEAAAMRSSPSVCDTSRETATQTQILPNNNNNNNFSNLNLQEVLFVPNENTAGMALPQNYEHANQRPMVSIPRFLTLSLIKPEQNTPMAEPEPQAIDLSTSSCAARDDNAAGNNSLEEVQIQLTQESSNCNGGTSREILFRIDNTLNGIKQEMNTRNLIEHRRLKLEAAKFKFLHPNFSFDV